ncbi:MAG: trypsin-like peptidase domain-containing protein [Mycobacterium sp.]|nr:trypsin-like peptidase domain-containing protein [Mycobacterium sp.]
MNITSLAVVPVSSPTGSSTTTQPQGIGSGFIYDVAGHIVTNNHVVEQADQLKVTFSDRTFATATLVGRDPDNDLAVILVNPSATRSNGRPVSESLQAVTLGDSDRLEAGEQAIAIGSPLGLQQTVTAGIVSALRSPGEDTGAGQGVDLLGGAVQTDASINPGNSGGPLFDSDGNVIGVNSAILSQSGGNEGIGFAIPINVVKRVAPELIQKGIYSHPQLGVAGVALSAMSPQTRQQLALPQQPPEGILVQQVSDGAESAGILAGTRTVIIGGRQVPAGGDVIVAIDGKPVATTGELRGYIENNKHPSDSVTLSIVRNQQPMDVKVVLGRRGP